MQILEWSRFLDEPAPFGGKPCAVTVGVFDGVHRGHRALIERIVSRNAVPVVITFKQIQRTKGAGGKYPGDISSFEQKMSLFEKLGVSAVVVVEFTESFKRTSGAEFFGILREHALMNFLTVGSNFRCGYKLDTDVDKIQKLNAENNIPTDIVRSLTENGRPISSSHIRAAVISGDLGAARAMLGCPFTVDLRGAPPVISDGGAVYGIAALGRVLPPAGVYHALLLGRRGARGEPAEIRVESGAVVLAKAAAGAEFVEFSG